MKCVIVMLYVCMFLYAIVCYRVLSLLTIFRAATATVTVIGNKYLNGKEAACNYFCDNGCSKQPTSAALVTDVDMKPISTCQDHSTQRENNPTANPGCVARHAQRMAGRTCPMRCLLIGPRTLDARHAVGREKSCCCFNFAEKGYRRSLHFVWRGSHNGAGTAQPTHEVTGLHRTASHGAM